MRIDAFVTMISCERLWDIEREIPAPLHVIVNVDILAFDEKAEGSVQFPFLFTVNFVPAVAQISMRGQVTLQGDRDEVQKILREGAEQKMSPAPVIRAVTETGLAEAILVAKTIGIPPPLPSIRPLTAEAPAKKQSQYM